MFRRQYIEEYLYKLQVEKKFFKKKQKVLTIKLKN